MTDWQMLVYDLIAAGFELEQRCSLPGSTSFKYGFLVTSLWQPMCFEPVPEAFAAAMTMHYLALEVLRHFLVELINEASLVFKPAFQIYISFLMFNLLIRLI